MKLNILFICNINFTINIIQAIISMCYIPDLTQLLLRSSPASTQLLMTFCEHLAFLL